MLIHFQATPGQLPQPEQWGGILITIAIVLFGPIVFAFIVALGRAGLELLRAPRTRRRAKPGRQTERRSSASPRPAARPEPRTPAPDPLVLLASSPTPVAGGDAPASAAATQMLGLAAGSARPWWQGWWEKLRQPVPQSDHQTADGDAPETEPPTSVTAAPVTAQASVAEPAPTGATDEPQIVSFRQWWRELWEIVNHLFVLGGTGSGKTTTVRAMVRYIALVLKHQVVILDPKANIDTWCGLRALTKAEAIEVMLQALLADFENRLERNATLTEAEAQRAFPHVWIVVDELSFVRDNCPTWPLLIRRLSSMARALNMHLIILNQSATAEEIGLKGRADLLKNFSRLQLTKAVWRGKPATLNLDGEVMTIEWKPVTVLSQKTPELPASARYVAPDLSAEERPAVIIAPAASMSVRPEAAVKSPAVSTPEVVPSAAVAQEPPREAPPTTPVAPATEEKTTSTSTEQRPITLTDEDRQVLGAAYEELSKGETEVSARGLARRAFGATGGTPWRKAAQFLAEVVNASVEGGLADRQSSPALAA